jgi:hypothetical protein
MRSLIAILALLAATQAGANEPLRLTLQVNPAPASAAIARPVARDPAADPLPRWVRRSVENTIDQYQEACGSRRSDITIALMASSPTAPRGWTCGAR